MSNPGSFGLGGGRGVLGFDDRARTEHVQIQHPLQRVLGFCRRTIDDVVNSPLVKNEVLGYYKVYRQIHRGAEVLDLERQWNAVEL
jgi:hypothetical protein